jgi:hypothetical protein
MSNIKILIVLLVIYFLYYEFQIENMNARPSALMKSNYINLILNNPHLFKNYGHAYNRFNWMDAVLYEDIRHLILNNKLTKNELEKIM